MLVIAKELFALVALGTFTLSALAWLDLLSYVA